MLFSYCDYKTHEKIIHFLTPTMLKERAIKLLVHAYSIPSNR